MARQTEFCKHYQAMASHDKCKAGIAYDTFKGLPFDERPCFQRDGKAPPGCELAAFPTAEEIEVREAEFRKRLEATGKARLAIVDYCGGPWKKGMPGRNGTIDCPVCGGVETLIFSRAGYNGHIHAGCQTEGCVAWME